MEEIAAEAGFTRGAVYSNFADKTDLFLAVLDERQRRRADEIVEIFQANDAPTAFFAALAESNRPRDEWVRQWVMLNTEFWLYAMRNEDVRHRLVEHNREMLRLTGQAVEAVLEAAGIDPPRPVDELARIIQGLDEGLTSLRLLDPDGIRRDLFLDTLGLLLESAAALDRERKAAATGTSPGSGRSRRRRG
jgi:AcrR family transcriptional regulator